MAVSIPLTGPIDLKTVWETVHQTTYTSGPISLASLCGAATNPGATYQPNGSTPYNLGDFRGYVHAWEGIFRFLNGYSISRTITGYYWVGSDPVYDSPDEEINVTVGAYGTLIVPFSGWFNGNVLISYEFYVSPGQCSGIVVRGYSSGNTLTLRNSYYRDGPAFQGNFLVGGDLGETTICCDFTLIS